jgi:hypothetical protein
VQIEVPWKLAHKLSDRLLSFAAAVIRIARRAKHSPVDRHLARQMVRSATSSEFQISDIRFQIEIEDWKIEGAA